MRKYSVEDIESFGKRATFFALGGARDGWIMPDGNGVDYAWYGQLVFLPHEICDVHVLESDVSTIT